MAIDLIGQPQNNEIDGVMHTNGWGDTEYPEPGYGDDIYGFSEFFDSYGEISAAVSGDWLVIKGVESNFDEPGLQGWVTEVDMVKDGILSHVNTVYSELDNGEYAITSTYFQQGQYIGMTQSSIMDQKDGLDAHFYVYDHEGKVLAAQGVKLNR